MVSSAGSSPAGRGLFIVTVTTGWESSRWDWSDRVVIHAPPRLESREYGSTMHRPSPDPSASNTSNVITSGW